MLFFSRFIVAYEAVIISRRVRGVNYVSKTNMQALCKHTTVLKLAVKWILSSGLLM